MMLLLQREMLLLLVLVLVLVTHALLRTAAAECEHLPTRRRRCACAVSPSAPYEGDQGSVFCEDVFVMCYPDCLTQRCGGSWCGGGRLWWLCRGMNALSPCLPLASFRTNRRFRTSG